MGPNGVDLRPMEANGGQWISLEALGLNGVHSTPIGPNGLAWSQMESNGASCVERHMPNVLFHMSYGVRHMPRVV
eukprot:1234396-Lingulodinium_polyedra.AAC.1